jgi:two-component system chemotaxis response regulator CheY
MIEIKILIVDDMSSMRAFIKAGIMASLPKDLSISFDESGSGEAAMKKLQMHHYDLIFCDWSMPNMKGVELLKWMRSQNNLKDIPFIMMTAYNTKEVLNEAVSLGISDFITKPVTLDVLGNKVRAIMAKILANKKSS